MRVAICDDEAITVKDIHTRLVNAMKAYTDKKIDISDFCDGQEMLEANKQEPFDVIFLDIKMPELDGIKIAKELRLNYTDQVIIFISSYDEYVYDVVFDSPDGFIRKSRIELDFPKAVKTVLQKHRDMMAVVFFDTSEGRIPIRTAKVWYFEAEGHYVKVHYAAGKSYMLKTSINAVESELRGSLFIRVHKTYLVNCKYIQRIDEYRLILEDDSVIKISRYRLKNVKKAYFELMGSI